MDVLQIQTQSEIDTKNDPKFQAREHLVQRSELHGVALSAQIRQNNEINKLVRSIEMAQNFWDNGRPPLGRVFAASGYRSRAATAYQGHVQVSWGLIQMPSNRTGRNTVSNHGRCVDMKSH